MMLAKRWLGLGLILAFAVCAPACGDDDDDNDDASGDDDDGGDDDNDENAYQMCDETSTALEGSDAVSTLVGVSADDVLEATGGGFVVTATWSDDTSLLTQSPLGGETQLTVTIAYEGGVIREVESVPNEDGGGGPEIAMDCRHRLEIDVTLGVETADGAFAESWPATLVQSLASDGAGLDAPSVAADFDPGALAGDFEIVAIEGPAPDAVTAMSQSTAADPIAGDVQIFVEQSSGGGDDGTVSQSSHIALAWGDAI